MSLDALAQCDVDVEVLTVQLERARQKQAALARERELREQEAAAAAAASATSTHASNINNDLQRQIDELKRQLALQDLELHTAVTIGSSHAADDNDDEQYHRGQDMSCKMPQRRSTIKERHSDPNQPPVRPNRHLSAVVPNPEQVAARVEAAVAEPADPHSPVHCHAPAPVAATAKGASEQAKLKHAWEKPDWALPDVVTATDDSIQTDSINHGLKPAAHSGYERKVHAKETLELIPGKFVAHQEKIPDPRMVWIVVNLDGSKVGKIAMHLYGNFLPLTDIFLELKGLELKHNSTAQQQQWYVDDIDPVFYVHQGPVGTFTGPKTACFGVVFEGQEVLQAINQAVPSGAVVTIKQSHIYPVKKAK